MTKTTTSLSVSRGFTLVEVMMAMLIMTVGLLGLLQSINVAYQHNSRNRLREEAVLVGEEWMNGFRSMAFDYITANKVVSTDRRPVAGGVKDFYITRDHQPLGTAGNAKKLTVAVAYVLHNRTTHHVIYTMRTR